METKSSRLQEMFRETEMRKSAKERGDMAQADEIRKSINTTFGQTLVAPVIIDYGFDVLIHPDLQYNEEFKKAAKHLAEVAEKAMKEGKQERARMVKRVMEQPYGRAFRIEG